jgi:hypothetical protein
MPRYIPFLKGKPAEFTSLARTNTATRTGMLPLVEAMPPADDSRSDHVEIVCRDAAAALASGWGTTDQVVLDSFYLPELLQLTAGVLPVEFLAQEARTAGLLAIPVARLNDHPQVTQAIAGILATDGRGVVIRVHGDDLQEDVTDIDIWLTDLIKDLGVSATDADLIIDLASVADTALPARVGRDIVQGLPSIMSWRSVTLAAGAFPVNLNGVPRASSALIPRLDAMVWRAVTSRSLPRIPDFGDYVIQHPTPPSGGWRAAPQIRYALADDWRIHKGDLRNPRGNDQFYDHCAQLVASGEASPATMSYGDDYVHQAAASAPSGAAPLVGPGNGTTWRAVGTSHHVAFVTDRLATTGAP